MDNVVQIGDLLIRRREERRSWSRDERCQHLNMTWDDNGEIVTCNDCSKQISPFWVMKLLVGHYESSLAKVRRRAEAVESDKRANLHLVAAKRVEKVWRSKSMVPCCPHCGGGILAEDRLGDTQINLRIELARRELSKKAASSPLPSSGEGGGDGRG